MRRLRLYMLVGGMPQAVKEYLETNNLSKTDAVKREILELYLDDFRKIDNSGRAAKLFANIPAQLNNNASRYQVASVLDDSERKNIMGILEEMKDSMDIRKEILNKNAEILGITPEELYDKASKEAGWK